MHDSLYRRCTAVAGLQGSQCCSHFKSTPGNVRFFWQGHATGTVTLGVSHSPARLPQLALAQVPASRGSSRPPSWAACPARLSQYCKPVLKRPQICPRWPVLLGWEPQSDSSQSDSSQCPAERAVNASYCDWFAIHVCAASLSGPFLHQAPNAARSGSCNTSVPP